MFVADEMFQTQRRLKALLAKAGLRPRKRYGQHFLIDRHLMRKLVDAAEIDSTDAVIEVGAGTGSLTGHLAARARTVVASEIDPALARIAAAQLGDWANVRWVIGDALAGKSRLSPELTAPALDATRGGGRLLLVANLPYDIATPLVLQVVIGALPASRLCFTVQKEVGERFVARAGDVAYGAASVVIGAMTEARRIARVPRRAFWPSPKVESVMLRLDRAPGGAGIEQPDLFAALVRRFFQQRRKTLERIGAAVGVKGELLESCAEAGVRAGARPEEVSVEQWKALAAGLLRRTPKAAWVGGAIGAK